MYDWKGELPKNIPKGHGDDGDRGGGCISPMHLIIQLQRDEERSGERRGAGGGISL